MSLRDLLLSIDELLSVRLPRARRSLREPASAEDLAKLAGHLGGALPAELEIWFAWHDGQRGTESLHPDFGSTALSIAEVLDAHTLLSTPGAQAPWDPAWLPLFHNGAGDYLVYASGPLILWRHDDPGRPQRFPSLEHLVRDMIKAVKLVKPRKVPMPGRYAWTPLPAEIQRAAQLGVGTVLCSRTPRLLTRVEEGKLVGVPGWLVNVYVKLAPSQWMTAMGHELDEATATASALAQWASFSDKPPSPKSGYFLAEETFATLAGMWLGTELD